MCEYEKSLYFNFRETFKNVMGNMELKFYVLIENVLYSLKEIRNVIQGSRIPLN